MTPRQLRQTLDTTLRETNPSEYLKMHANNELEPYLESLMGQYVQSVESGREAVLNQLAEKRVTVNDLSMLFLEIEREALDQVVGQINDFQITEFDPES